MTTRTLTPASLGPVLVDLDVPVGALTVVSDPGCERAEVTVRATGDDPVLAAAVRDAELSVTDAGGPVLSVRVALPAGTGTTTVLGGHGTTVVQSIGNVVAGTSIVGAQINGDIVSGRIIVNGVTVSGPGMVVTGPAGNLEVTARVPEGSSVMARTRAADLEATGEFNRITFESVSGSVRAGGTGTLAANTTSGDVRATAVDREATIRTVSGDIALGRCDQVHAQAVSGDITVADFGGTASLRTVSGDITVRAAEGGTITAAATSGDVTVTATGAALAEGLRVTATSLTGHVSTPQDAPATTRTRRPRRTAGDA